MNKLPTPQDEITRQAYAQIERMDAMNHKRNQDIELGDTALIITSPNGTRYKLIVSDAGVLSTMAV